MGVVLMFIVRRHILTAERNKWKLLPGKRLLMIESPEQLKQFQEHERQQSKAPTGQQKRLSVS
jgi:hypothetical protein